MSCCLWLEVLSCWEIFESCKFILFQIFHELFSSACSKCLGCCHFIPKNLFLCWLVYIDPKNCEVLSFLLAVSTFWSSHSVSITSDWIILLQPHIFRSHGDYWFSCRCLWNIDVESYTSLHSCLRCSLVVSPFSLHLIPLHCPGFSCCFLFSFLNSLWMLFFAVLLLFPHYKCCALIEVKKLFISPFGVRSINMVVIFVSCALSFWPLRGHNRPSSISVFHVNFV